MVMVLEDYLVLEIAAIGERRRPAEACGILLPYKVNNRQVIELPNRSKTPHDEILMMGDDVLMELKSVFGEGVRFPENLSQELTFWHTHPNGNLGPSKYDMENKVNIGKHLVVTLGDPPKATWF